MSTTLVFLVLMIPGTFFLGLNDVLVRKVLSGGKVNSRLLAAYSFFSVGILLSLFLLFTGLPELKTGFWTAIIITAFLNIFAQWAWYTAFKKEEASLISPLRLITPPLVIITGFLTLNEKTTIPGALGILLTVFGLWILLQSEAAFKETRLRDVIKRPGVLLGIWGAVSFAISFPFDKKAVVASSGLLTAVIAFLAVGLGNAFIVYLRKFKEEKPSLDFKNNWRILALVPVVHSIAAFLTFQALNYSLAAYAASLKRLWSFWAVLLSGQFLREKNIGRKLLATAIMLFGIAVTVFLG